MPLYDYICKCGTKKEILLTHKEVKNINDILCPSCRLEYMERKTIPSSPSTFHLKGKGWAKDGY